MFNNPALTIAKAFGAYLKNILTRKELIAYYKKGVSLNKLSTLITNHFIENPNYEKGKTIHKWLVDKSKSINQYNREFGKMFCENLLISGLYIEAISELNYQLKNEDYYTFSEKEIVKILIKVKSKLETQIISGIHIYRLSWLTKAKPLTNFGDRNLSEVLKYIDLVINEEYKDVVSKLKSQPHKQHIWFLPIHKANAEKTKRAVFCQRSKKKRNEIRKTVNE